MKAYLILAITLITQAAIVDDKKPHLCNNKWCKLNQICVNGNCVLNVCPTKSVYQPIPCPNPRPKKCPIIYYIKAPDPAFCGIKSDGTRQSYVKLCDMCKDPTVQYYLRIPCEKDAPFICTYPQKFQGYYCSGVCGRNMPCKWEWQICKNNRCVDKCVDICCFEGYCRFGQCYNDDVYDEFEYQKILNVLEQLIQGKKEMI